MSTMDNITQPHMHGQSEDIQSGVAVLKAKKIFIGLATMNLMLGLAILVSGSLAFSFTPDYRVGSFWTAFLLLASFFYNTGWLAARLLWSDNSFIKNHSRALGAVSATISIITFAGCLVSAILDVIAFYLLTKTDFSECQFTNTTITATCSSPLCPTLDLPPQTCYCCYLYDDRTTGGCNTPFLLAKQTVFRGVSSCEALSSELGPILKILCVMNFAAAIVCLVYFFQTTPLQYLVKKVQQDGGASKESKLMMFVCRLFGVQRIPTATKPGDFSECAVKEA